MQVERNSGSQAVRSQQGSRAALNMVQAGTELSAGGAHPLEEQVQLWVGVGVPSDLKQRREDV